MNEFGDLEMVMDDDITMDTSEKDAGAKETGTGEDSGSKNEGNKALGFVFFFEE